MSRLGMRGAAIAGLAAAGLASAAWASPATGRWHTPGAGGVVEVTDCGPGICGRLVTSKRIEAEPGLKDAMNKNAALRGRPLKGVPLFEDLTGGPKVWTGKVYNPQDGRIYSGSVTLVDADTLKLTGCVFRPLCATQTWTRIH